MTSKDFTQHYGCSLYLSVMKHQPSVGDLRDILRCLRDEIERLEYVTQNPNKRAFATRQRVHEAKIQELVLLAKLDELEPKQ